MLYPTKEKWEAWGIEDECHKFFVLHWHELFHAETPDTWQVRTCNIVTLLEEMIEAARIAEGFDAYRGVLRSILDETFPVVRRDMVVRNTIPSSPRTSNLGKKRRSARISQPRCNSWQR
jgi:hypothetical protein